MDGGTSGVLRWCRSMNGVFILWVLAYLACPVQSVPRARSQVGVDAVGQLHVQPQRRPHKAKHTQSGFIRRERTSKRDWKNEANVLAAELGPDAAASKTKERFLLQRQHGAMCLPGQFHIMSKVDCYLASKTLNMAWNGAVRWGDHVNGCFALDLQSPGGNLGVYFNAEGQALGMSAAGMAVCNTEHKDAGTNKLLGMTYILHNRSGHPCPARTAVKTYRQCEAAATVLGKKWSTEVSLGAWETHLRGCFLLGGNGHHAGTLKWNEATSKEQRGAKGTAVCTKEVPRFMVQTIAAAACDEGKEPITSVHECKEAAAALGKGWAAESVGRWADHVNGCFEGDLNGGLHNGHLHFNEGGQNAGPHGFVVCKDSLGTVLLQEDSGYTDKEHPLDGKEESEVAKVVKEEQKAEAAAEKAEVAAERAKVEVQQAKGTSASPCSQNSHRTTAGAAAASPCDAAQPPAPEGSTSPGPQSDTGLPGPPGPPGVPVVPIPIDCLWHDWEHWTDCTKSCGEWGVRRREREVNVYPQNNGRNCEGLRKEAEACNRVKCPVMAETERSEEAEEGGHEIEEEHQTAAEHAAEEEHEVEEEREAAEERAAENEHAVEEEHEPEKEHMRQGHVVEEQAKPVVIEDGQEQKVAAPSEAARVIVVPLPVTHAVGPAPSPAHPVVIPVS